VDRVIESFISNLTSLYFSLVDLYLRRQLSHKNALAIGSRVLTAVSGMIPPPINN